MFRNHRYKLPEIAALFKKKTDLLDEALYSNGAERPFDRPVLG